MTTQEPLGAAAPSKPTSSSPPRSPDGLGERWDHEVTHGATTRVRDIRAGLSAKRSKPRHSLDVQDLAFLLDRIDTLTEQVRVLREDRDERVAHEEALRSENARLTEQVRGAEGVVEAALEIQRTSLYTHVSYKPCAACDLDAALSIYDEGAARGGRSGSASPQSGDGVSGVDAAPTSRTEEVK